MIRAVLFDLDDTLLDFAPAPDRRTLFDEGASRTYAYLTVKGCSLPSFEQYCRVQRSAFRRARWITWLSGAEPDGRRALRRVCAELGVQRDQAALAKLGWLWYEPIARTAALAPDVIPTLAALRDSGLKLALVCNTSAQGEIVDRLLEMHGLLEFFPVRAYSTDVGAHKPHPRIFHVALAQLEIAPPDALFIGDDVQADMLGARRVGIRTVFRTARGGRAGWRARRASHHVIQRIAQLLDLPELRQLRDATAAIPEGAFQTA